MQHKEEDSHRRWRKNVFTSDRLVGWRARKVSSCRRSADDRTGFEMIRIPPVRFAGHDPVDDG